MPRPLAPRPADSEGQCSGQASVGGCSHAVIGNGNDEYFNVFETVKEILTDHKDHERSESCEEEFARFMSSFKRATVPTAHYVFSEMVGLYREHQRIRFELHAFTARRRDRAPHFRGDPHTFHTHLYTFIGATITIMQSLGRAASKVTHLLQTAMAERTSHESRPSVGRIVLACYAAMDLIGWSPCGFDLNSIRLLDDAFKVILQVMSVSLDRQEVLKGDSQVLLSNNLLAIETRKALRKLSGKDADRVPDMEGNMDHLLLQALQSGDHTALYHWSDGFLADSKSVVYLARSETQHPASHFWHIDLQNGSGWHATDMAHSIVAAASRLLHDRRQNEQKHLPSFIYDFLSFKQQQDTLGEFETWSAAKKNKVFVLSVLYIGTFKHTQAFKNMVPWKFWTAAPDCRHLSLFDTLFLDLVERLAKGFELVSAQVEQVEQGDQDASGDEVMYERQLAHRSGPVAVLRSSFAESGRRWNSA
ncbi:hypothetical protein ACM66B_003165 [Microbotryomycetes sp. NB124-2]